MSILRLVVCVLGLINKLLLRDDEDLDNFMNTVVKETLQIPEEIIWGGQSNDVFSALYEDFMKPATEVGMYRLDQFEAFNRKTFVESNVVPQRIGQSKTDYSSCMLPEA
jgi:hypothetical protein